MEVLVKRTARPAWLHAALVSSVASLVELVHH